VLWPRPLANARSTVCADSIAQPTLPVSARSIDAWRHFSVVQTPACVRVGGARRQFKRTEEEYAREEDDGEHMKNQVKAHEEDGGSDDADDEEDPALADLKAVREEREDEAQEKLEKAAKKAAKKAKQKGKKAARGDDDEEGW